LVAKDKTQNPINFLYIPKWLPPCKRKMQLSKRERSAYWIPSEIVYLVEEVLVLLRSKFSSDVTKKLKCSGWEDVVG
jgi:hypothetical protein